MGLRAVDLATRVASGAWSPVAIDVIRHSLKELGILAAVPEAKAIYNDQFVPVKF